MPANRKLSLIAATAFALLMHEVCGGSEGQRSKESPTPENIETFRDLQQIFAPRSVDVEILGMKPPEEYVRLQTAFTKSIQKNQAWMLEYVKANAAGGPLPYHENFGITRAEYEKLHKLIKQLKLVPVAKGRLRFSRVSDDQIQIDGIDGLHEFDGTVIDFKQELVITRWGKVPHERIAHVGEDSAIGAWDGARCHLSTGSPESGNASLLRIDIGRQAASQLNFFCLSVRVVENGVKTESVEIPVLFP